MNIKRLFFACLLIFFKLASASPDSLVEMGYTHKWTSNDYEFILRYQRELSGYFFYGSEASFGRSVWCCDAFYTEVAGNSYPNPSESTIQAGSSVNALIGVGWPSSINGIFLSGRLGLGYVDSSATFEWLADSKTQSVQSESHGQSQFYFSYGTAIGLRYADPSGISLGFEFSSRLFEPSPGCLQGWHQAPSWLSSVGPQGSVSTLPNGAKAVCFSSSPPFSAIWHFLVGYNF